MMEHKTHALGPDESLGTFHHSFIRVLPFASFVLKLSRFLDIHSESELNHFDLRVASITKSDLFMVHNCH